MSQAKEVYFSITYEDGDRLVVQGEWATLLSEDISQSGPIWCFAFPGGSSCQMLTCIRPTWVCFFFFFKQGVLNPNTRVSDSVCLGWGQRTWISKKLPGNADAAGQKTRFAEALPSNSILILIDPKEGKKWKSKKIWLRSYT